MKTCLVVDDSGVVRKVARRILEDLSFNVREAADGQAALKACEEAMPDGILLDWNMPVMEGIEFLELLRKTEGGDVPRVIFCTTNNDIEHITRAIEAGANEYIMKPFDQDILREKLEEVGLLEKAPAT
ncbi:MULTISPECIES: response regulator [Azorhizobium]|uniref:Chemotaxis response regulator n=1 Tax=Azorhizobium caulinodans (strain ATCC 43989 / DSM 5975 / JCM 20966 / LMG 6465 / NBRC 14845 / NCIMB 13405 / ORS 571) TaxID=438753 RepID=A8IPP2_AZOC5|nr:MULTISPECIES: response regulator [Azorhizobium]TDT88865.1 response regulator receiver protein [Azorhizobium sp. AG788]BAF86661.1 chemotaxis response regulator [Azorhizobium caulinodans ORS 571]